MRFRLLYEWRIRLFISLFVATVAVLPQVWAYINAPEGYFFTGLNFTTNYDDIQGVYMAAMLRSSTGEILYREAFDPELAPVFHMPVYVFLGKIVALTSWSVPFVYHLASFTISFGFSVFLFKLLQIFFSDLRRQILAFSLAIFGGFFLLRTQEAIGIFSFFTPHLVISEASLLYSLYLLFLISTKKNFPLKNLVNFFFSTLILAILHPWMLIPMSFFYLFWSCYLFRKRVKFGRTNLIVFLIILCNSVPFLIYYRLSLPWTRLPLEVYWYFLLLTYGIIFPISIVSVVRIIREGVIRSHRDKLYLFFAFWLITQLIFIHLPIFFQRKFIEGMFLPVSVFSVLTIDLLVKKYKLESLINIVYSKAFLYISIGVIVNYLLHLAWLPNNYVYRRIEEKEAAVILTDRANRDQIILASPQTGILFAHLVNIKIFAGQKHQTPNFKEKEEFIKNYYGGDLSFSDRRRMLEGKKICYVYYGPEERNIGSIDLSGEDYLAEFFKNDLITIYKSKWC